MTNSQNPNGLLVLRPHRTEEIVYPGNILSDHINEWVYARVQPQAMLIALQHLSDKTLIDRERSSFSNWIEEVTIAVDGLSRLREIDKRRGEQ